MSLLYIGAFTDAFPILRYGSEFKTFIYVDGLPKSNYFPKECHGYKTGKDLESMMSALIEELGDSYDKHAYKEDVVKIYTKGGQEILYHYNVIDKDIGQTNGLKDILDGVTCLVLKGFSPKIDFELPNLKKIYLTENCQDDYPDNIVNGQINMDDIKVITITDTEDREGKDVHQFLTDCPDCGEMIYINSM